ncbi:fatty acid biosynthesis 1 [Perilla frutescens var. frutescens]|nr:fatty acid biosynthesis 1 [Perilla frutescens var. frutescens]
MEVDVYNLDFEGIVSMHGNVVHLNNKLLGYFKLRSSRNQCANHIIRDEADVILCGGSDAAIIPIGLGGFVACRALSQRNTDPTKASCPWDSGRDGFVMGERAGVLLLEELKYAKQRGATIYAEFLGRSFTCDAYHMTKPHPEGNRI